MLYLHTCVSLPLRLRMDIVSTTSVELFEETCQSLSMYINVKDLSQIQRDMTSLTVASYTILLSLYQFKTGSRVPMTFGLFVKSDQ